MLVGLRDGEDKGQMPELGSTKASIALEKMQPEYGVLEAMREADETLHIVGYRRFDRTPQPTVPLNNDSLDGAKMILIGNVLTEEGESEVELGGPIRLTEEEGRGLSVVRKPISQIRGLDADRVLATGEVCDIYFHEYDITGKMRKADGM